MVVCSIDIRENYSLYLALVKRPNAKLNFAIKDAMSQQLGRTEYINNRFPLIIGSCGIQLEGTSQIVIIVFDKNGLYFITQNSHF